MAILNVHLGTKIRHAGINFKVVLGDVSCLIRILSCTLCTSLLLCLSPNAKIVQSRSFP